MRTTTAGEDTVLAARQSAHHLKVEIKNAAGTWVAYDALSSLDWQDRVEIQKDVNQRVAQLTCRMFRESDGNSLAPLINSDIDAGRAIRVSGARVAIGATPGASDYKLLFLGEIDRWDAASDPMELVARDDTGHLADRWVESETEYGTEAGRAIESVIQDILDDWTDGRFTLYTPTSPGFLVTRYLQQEESALSALQTLADLIGWAIDYEWDDGTSQFRLTFSEPDRTPASTAWTFGADDYYDVTRLSVDRLEVRNVVTVRYTDASTEARSEATVEDTTSKDKYGRRWMEIQEGDDSPIDSDAEATTLATAALNDLSTPVAEQEIETDFFWPIQLGDFYGFTANDVHYDVDQEFAVTGYTHTFEAGRALTRIQTRGAGAVGHTRGWIKREKKERPPREKEAGLKILDFRLVEENEEEAVYAGKLGTDLDELWIHSFQKDFPFSEDHWPGSTRPPDDVSDDREFTITVPRPAAGKLGFLQVEGRITGQSFAYDVQRALVFPTSTAGDYIAFAEAIVNQADGSVKIRGWTTERANSVAYAYNVGEDPDPPTEGQTESQGASGVTGGGLATGFTSDFEITLPASTVPHGSQIKGLLIAYINADGTGPDGTSGDHDTPRGFYGERIKIHDADGLAERIVVAGKLTDDTVAYGLTANTFSATDWDTVAWGASTLTLATGDSHSIGSGNTGNMASDVPHLIYWSRSSPTVFQVTTDFDVATGQDKILLCVAVRASTGASSGQDAGFFPAVGQLGLNEDHLSPASVSTNILQANSVTAVKANIAFLSALASDIGVVVAGLLQNGAGTFVIDLDATGTDPLISHTNFELLADGTANFAGTISSGATVNATTLSANGGTLSIPNGVDVGGISTPGSKINLDSAGHIRAFSGGSETWEITNTASNSGATEQAWIEVQVGGTTGYLRVYASQ